MSENAGTDQPSVADLTLERVRCIEGAIEELARAMAAQGEKIDALIELSSGNFGGLTKLYASHDKTITRIEKRLERIERRLDLTEHVT